MQMEANRKLKVVYSINLFQATVIPFTFGLIGNVIEGFKLSPDYFGRAAVCLLLLMLFGYRIYGVTRKAEALTFLSARSVAKAVRAFSIFLMWVGVLAIPILIAIVTVSFIFEAKWLIALGFIAPIWLGFTVGAGFVGFILFESTRLVTIWTN